MPLCNRCDPAGTLHADHARGTMMGNRGGQMHIPATQRLKAGQPWVSRRWIACVLAFKNRHRRVWTEGYTELFFLDDATALSAGHRPCFECRRADARRFQATLFSALAADQGWARPPSADMMDRLLHDARVPRHPIQGLRSQAVHLPLAALPVGAFFLAAAPGEPATYHAVTPGGPMRWTFQGYQRPAPELTADTSVALVTPQPLFAVLETGYEPSWHPSAMAKPSTQET